MLAMKGLSIPELNLFIDKQSGKSFDRPEYRRMMQCLKEDDLIYVKSIDRLGAELFRNSGSVTDSDKREKADIVVFDMPLPDTRRGKDLMGTFLSDIVLQVMSFVAENKRANIRQRQAEGIAAAKAKGVRFGRPPHPLPDNFDLIYQLWKSKKSHRHIRCKAMRYAALHIPLPRADI